MGSDITMRQMQYLVALAQEKNFSAAARKCHVSQPALVEQIEKLESRLGSLVVRGRRQTTLTPLGGAVVERARSALAAVAEIERIAKFPDAIHIGMIDTVAPYLMPGLMSARAERIIPAQAHTAELLTALSAGRIDAAVLAAGTIPRGLHSIELGTEELMLVVPVNDAAFDGVKPSQRVSMSSASDHEMLLLADGHCLRDQVVDVCRTARSSIGPLEAGTIEMLVEMVAKHLGVTLIPAIAAPSITRHEGVRVLRMKDAPKRTLHLVSTHRPSQKISEVASTLSELLTKR